MIFTLIMGFVVGVFYPQAQPYVAKGAEQAGLDIKDALLPAATLLLALAAMAVALGLLGVSKAPVLLLLGAAIGVLKDPILARITSR